MFRLKKSKAKAQKIPALSQSTVFAKSPKSGEKKYFESKTITSPGKTPTASQQSSSNIPSFSQLSSEQSPASSHRKSNRHGVGEVNTFSREVAMVVTTDLKKVISSLSSSQTSSKVSSPNPMAKMIKSAKK